MSRSPESLYTIVARFLTLRNVHCPSNLSELTRGTVYTAPHVTRFRIYVEKLISQAQELPEDVTALENIADLGVQVASSMPGSYILPVVSMISRLTKLTSISWVHQAGEYDPAQFTYAQKLLEAFVQLPTLQSLHVKAQGFYSKPSHDLLVSSLIALSSLTRLSLYNTDTRLLNSVFHELPSSLVSLPLEVPPELRPHARLFDSMGLAHLPNLEKLHLQATFSDQAGYLFLGTLLEQFRRLSALCLRLSGGQGLEPFVKYLCTCASAYASAPASAYSFIFWRMFCSEESSEHRLACAPGQSM